MTRLAKLGGLLRVAVQASRFELALPVAQEAQAPKALPSLLRHFHSSSPARNATPTTTDAGVEEVLKEQYEHVTGLEKYEVENKLKGIDVWEETWLKEPWGTADKPVVVPSSYESRIVGVPDPDDDSLVWWGIIEDGQPPKQIIEGGEYFVLKRIAAPEGEGHH